MARLPDTINSYVKKPNKSKRKNKLNRQYPQLIDQQWATAYVKKVIINKDHPEAMGDNSMVNAIIAIVHGDNLEANYGGDIAGSVFYPLMRGIADVPSKGDQVLVCRFAGVSYYLGPLNINNKPCINEDNRFGEIINSGYNAYDYSYDINSKDDVYTEYQNRYVEEGISPYFPNYCPARLEKPYIHPSEKGDSSFDLDGVGHRLSLKEMEESDDINTSFLREIPGDLILEGKMGNSIRLGQRYKHPITVITNRGEDLTSDAYERTTNGSILAMIERGAIHDNFGLGPGMTNGRGSTSKFITSNDIRVGGLTADGKEVVYGFGVGGDTNLYDYTYGNDINPGNQILLRSGRITIDSNRDSIFLSSLKSVIVGGGEKVIVRANNSVHIESEKIVLGGNHSSYEEEPDTTSDDYEGMIFGDTFIEAFKTFLSGLKTMTVPTSLGPQDSNMIVTTDANLNATITNLEQELDKVISKKHFIENKKQ